VRENKEVLLHSKVYATEQPWLSWWHLLSTFSVFGLLVGLTLVSESVAVRLPAGFLLGLVMVRIFILYHDSEHGTIFRRSRVGQTILKVYGLLVLNPPSIWRRSHDHHHRNNAKIYGASIGSYPVMTREKYEQSSRGARFVYAVSRHPVTIAMGYLTIFFWGMCVRSFLVSPKAHWDSALAIVLHVSLVVALLFVQPALVLYVVVIPMLVASGLGAYLFYAQHNFPAVKLSGREDWDYFFAALHSSSFIRMSPVLSWFTGNIGYHHVHHLNARIPFYRLPEAMAGIEELQSPGETSLGVWDVWRCFRLKLWDAAAGRMISFRDAHNSPASG
jgi:omega-6 fatty acid desaturase (delta-12 desaturase)